LNLIRYIAQCDLVNFPHSLWGIVTSAENLTPRGLQSTFSATEDDTFQSHQFDSFLLSKRRELSHDEEMKDDTSAALANQKGKAN
jgi:hypothetical protein